MKCDIVPSGPIMIAVLNCKGQMVGLSFILPVASHCANVITNIDVALFQCEIFTFHEIMIAEKTVNTICVITENVINKIN